MKIDLDNWLVLPNRKWHQHTWSDQSDHFEPSGTRSELSATQPDQVGASSQPNCAVSPVRRDHESLPPFFVLGKSARPLSLKHNSQHGHTIWNRQRADTTQLIRITRPSPDNTLPPCLLHLPGKYALAKSSRSSNTHGHNWSKTEKVRLSVSRTLASVGWQLEGARTLVLSS